MRDALLRVIKDIYSGKQLSIAIRDAELSNSQFFTNLVKHEDLQFQYKQARQVRADLFADDIVNIADNVDIDPTRARNMIEARKWVASKYSPKTYGDKLDIEVTKTVDISDAIEQARRRAIEARGTPISIENAITPDIEGIGQSEPDIFD